MSPAGRAAPGGGIIPARSLRIIRSAMSAFSAARATSKSSRTRLPRRRRWLWQPVQYSWTTSVRGWVGAGGRMSESALPASQAPGGLRWAPGDLVWAPGDRMSGWGALGAVGGNCAPMGALCIPVGGNCMPVGYGCMTLSPTEVPVMRAAAPAGIRWGAGAIGVVRPSPAPTAVTITVPPRATTGSACLMDMP